MVAHWIRLAGGLLDIEIHGAELERFLNLCTAKKITLRKPKRTDIDRMTAQISLADFYCLARAKKRTRCRVHVLRRRGLPFLWQKLRHRYGLFVGLFLMCSVCYVLSTRIWVIETDFTQDVDRDAVMQELEELGIGIGTKGSSIDAKAVKLHMMTELDELKYFSAVVDGDILELQAAAVTEPPENEAPQGVHSLIAGKDGIIQKMTAHRGTVLCKPGDAVLRGQTLIDALVEKAGELDENHLTDANGEIWADVRYYSTRKMALQADRKYKTGKEKKRYAICFAKTRINLFFTSSLTQENCDRIITTEKIRFNEHLALPISLCCETTIPYIAKTVLLDAEELQGKMEYGARRAVEHQIAEGNLISMQADLSTQQEAAVLHSVIWTYEQIGERIEDTRTQADIPQEIETKSEE